MKINWFSPLPPANTGIADYTLGLLPALKNHCQLVLWTNEFNWNKELEQYADIRHYQLDSIPWAEINQGDLNIYHIGNNHHFHGTIWQISRQCPGLIVLHDFKLHDFFYCLYRNTFNDPMGYLKQIRKYYGTDGKKTAQKFCENVISAATMANHYPLTNAAIENAVGVIVHTRQAYQALAKENRWLVGYLPLPYAKINQLSRQVEANHDVPYRLVIFGYIGTNRRLEVVLEALAQFNQKNCFRLDIYGQLFDENYFIQRIKDLQLSNLVTIHGFVSKIELETALVNADLAINLRYPTMGEASLSQLLIWSHALPSLVTQTGWYAELPNNTVAYVRLAHEISDIHKHLQCFLNNPQSYRDMGKKAKQSFDDYHQPEVYAKALVNIAEKASLLKTQAVSKYLIEKVGEKISPWTNSELGDMNFKQLAKTIEFICLKNDLSLNEQ